MGEVGLAQRRHSGEFNGRFAPEAATRDAPANLTARAASPGAAYGTKALATRRRRVHPGAFAIEGDFDEISIDSKSIDYAAIVRLLTLKVVVYQPAGWGLNSDGVADVSVGMLRHE
jgi:hypothetical protein